MKTPKVTFSFAAMVCILAWLDWKICLGFLLSAFVHELGHLAAMKLCKVPIGSIVISAAGAKIESRTMGVLTELYCAAAGPLAGVVFALVILRVLPQTAVISFFLSVINMLPLYPLDGGRMVRSVLCMRMDEEKVRKIMRTITFITCSLLMLCACWGVVWLQMGIWPIFAALILLCRSAHHGE